MQNRFPLPLVLLVVLTASVAFVASACASLPPEYGAPAESVPDSEAPVGVPVAGVVGAKLPENPSETVLSERLLDAITARRHEAFCAALTHAAEGVSAGVPLAERAVNLDAVIPHAPTEARSFFTALAALHHQFAVNPFNALATAQQRALLDQNESARTHVLNDCGVDVAAELAFP